MTTSNPDKPRCAAMTKAGQRCRGWPDASGFCPAHRENARDIQVLGGKCRSRQYQLERRLPSRLKPVLEMLGKAMVETHEGTLNPSRAQAMASLATKAGVEGRQRLLARQARRPPPKPRRSAA